MKRIVFAALALLGAIAPARAQQATTVSSCGSITWDTAGVPRPVTQDLNGKLCTGATASGTVAATQSGTWTVQPGNTANTTAWKVDGSAVTQPVTNLYQATASAAISISTATTTQIIAISGSKAIYISHIDFISGGTDAVTLEYGTGSTCGTGTTVLTGAYGLLTGSGLSAGNGVAPFLFVPAGNALCILTSAAVQISGAVSYAQF